MRENLFRGKPTERFKDFLVLRKEFCENGFVYGSLVVSNNRYYICVSGICSSRSIVNNGITTMVEVIPETVGQYTGLTDKNGKKIFEGDYWIDTDENDIFVVEFRNGQFCFVIYGICGALMPYGYDETAGGFGECDCVSMTDYNIDTIEIIGNIHDSPELLKGGVEK